MSDKNDTTPELFKFQHSPEACLDRLFRCYLMDLECCIPAIVEEYDRERHIAVVQPLVNLVGSNGDELVRAKLSVTVLRSCHGGYLFDMPINKGDTGWIVASDRDTSIVKQENAFLDSSKNKGAQKPNTYRIHKFANGFFVCDNWAKIPLSEKFRESLVLGKMFDEENLRGISISDSSVGIYSNEINNYGDLFVRKYKNSNGNLSVEGDLNVGGKSWFRGIVEFFKTVIFNAEVLFKSYITVGSRRRAIINPDEDLGRTDAKFREIMMVTGIDKDNTGNGKVTLKVQTVRALVDLPTATEPISFEVGTSESGGEGEGGGDSGNSEITISGNGGGSFTGNNFPFTTGADSNIIITVNAETGEVVFDAYYT